MDPDDRLESWKEIAAYLHRDVRTVQRWEAAEGLPVHRHQHKKRGSVCALRLDASRLVAARFDGRATLGEIAHQVACELAWDEAYAFAYVRGIFLQLVSTGLYLPKS